jgi:hypothetical protein
MENRLMMSSLRIYPKALLLCMCLLVCGCSGTSVDELAGDLADQNHDSRYDAAKQLEAYGPEAVGAVDELAAALSDPAPKVRYRSAKVLSKIGIGASPAAEALAKALPGAEDKTRYYIVKALANIEDAAISAVEDITHILEKDDDPRTRYYAAKALGKIGKEARLALPVLEKAQGDADEKVRKAATEAIAKVNQ